MRIIQRRLHILDLEDYFSFAKNSKDFKMKVLSSKLVSNATNWWSEYNILDCEKVLRISLWPRTKRLMVN